MLLARETQNGLALCKLITLQLKVENPVAQFAQVLKYHRVFYPSMG